MKNGEKRGSYLKTISPEERKVIASAGGRAVSADRAHMSEIGKKGGSAASHDREWMREIGRRGGEASRGIPKKPRVKKPPGQVE